MLSHLENFLAQRELAINAAVAASAQMGVPRVPSPPAGITIHPTPGPFIPIQTQRSPTTPTASLTECIPISVALPTPVISFANTATMPVFGATSIASLGTLPTATIPITTAKIDQSVSRFEQPLSPIKPFKTITIAKTPFRPWAIDENDV